MTVPRRLCLRLAALSPRDRKWLLQRLPAPARRRLELALAEIPGWTDGRRKLLPEVLRSLALRSERTAAVPAERENPALDHLLASLDAEWGALVRRLMTDDPMGELPPVLVSALRQAVQTHLDRPAVDFAALLNDAVPTEDAA